MGNGNDTKIPSERGQGKRFTFTRSAAKAVTRPLHYNAQVNMSCTRSNSKMDGSLRPFFTAGGVRQELAMWRPTTGDDFRGRPPPGVEVFVKSAAGLLFRRMHSR